MAAIDSEGTVITFDGVAISGIERYDVMAGTPRFITFRPLNGAPTESPLEPEFGQCVLDLIRDKADPGQAKLLASYKNKTKATMIVTAKDGTTDTFTAFCVLLPMSGSKNPDAPINTARAILRIDGAIT
ncbi:MAG: hypothetical protein COA78_06960 [Blastopirellula sp.]|nr:MAG: hypothetical protein COA78_06960 [Blastopirellula sp.]